jgi:hypothetical protein
MKQPDIDKLRNNQRALKKLILSMFKNITSKSVVKISPEQYILNDTHTIWFEIGTGKEYFKGSITYKLGNNLNETIQS